MILLSDLLQATGGALLQPPGTMPDAVLLGFCFDSRRARPGELFVALKTDRGDGHDFIADALERGCAGALVDERRTANGADALAPDPPAHTRPGRPTPLLIAVPDTLTALTDYARFIVKRRGLPVVAITGSVGKTGAREAISAVLSKKYQVFRNPANFNGRLGLSIALGALEPGHELLVLEMGTDAPGEIRDLCDIAPPLVGIVTQVSESHLAFFGSLDAIAREKAALIEALPPNGLAILNAADPRVWAMRERTTARVEGVGRSVEAGSRSEKLDGRGHKPDGWRLAADIARQVGRFFGVPEADIEDALDHLDPLPGRMNPLPGVNGITLIDDTFNANPTSMRAAIDAALNGYVSAGGSDRSALFLLLGDMDQLGDESIRYHRELGRFIAQAATDSAREVTLITLGEQARHIADAAIEAGLPPSRAATTYVLRDAVDAVVRLGRPGDVVLLKGDVSARLERAVAALLADPADRAKLARQEPGWESVRIAQPARPTWLEVDLEAIAHNTRLIKQWIGPDVALMATLKADGYGHGAVKVARTALNNGASWCGVASLSEAAALRTANIDEPILILGYTPAWHARDALLRDVAVTIYDLDIARAFSRAAVELRRTARVHIKIDTGMGRLGVLPEQAADLVRAVSELPGMCIEGLFTHFSCADTDPDFTRCQLDRFRAAAAASLAALPPEARQKVRYLHAANSAAALAYPETRLNLVRVGLALYGLWPFSPSLTPPALGGTDSGRALDLRPALAWKTTIAQVKTLPDGAPVSYGATYRCRGERQVAVIPVGYADGFRRAPQHFGEVLVRGRRAPIIGRVCMDQTILDVTGIPGVRIGDPVVLIGRQGDESITADDVAERLGTISYEVVSAILARVPRVS